MNGDMEKCLHLIQCYLSFFDSFVHTICGTIILSNQTKTANTHIHTANIFLIHKWSTKWKRELHLHQTEVHIHIHLYTHNLYVWLFNDLALGRFVINIFWTYIFKQLLITSVSNGMKTHEKWKHSKYKKIKSKLNENTRKERKHYGQ